MTESTRIPAPPDEIVAAFDARLRELGCIPPDTTDSVAMEGTDTDNARRLAEILQRDFRFVLPQKVWAAWTGTHWVLGTTEHHDAEAMAASHTPEVAAQYYAEAMALAPGNDRELMRRQDILLRWARTSYSEAAQRHMMAIVCRDPRLSAPVSAFDHDAWLLNCANGTLDLRTGTLRAHAQGDMLTHCLPIAYDPGARAPRWEQFLREVFGDDSEMIDYIHRAVGYSITGSIREQVAHICYGTGANGKSCFLGALRKVLGPLSMQTSIETFALRDAARIPEDRARLRGARFVVASESHAGQVLDEAFIKDSTGGEPVVARQLYENSFQFEPQFKLWLATNHQPTIRGTDNGIWRRIRLIPLTRTFSEAERDPDLPAKLAAEIQGILTWAVQGCLAWQERGLAACPAVAAATLEYRSDSDVLGQFLAERCEFDPAASTRTAPLYAAYSRWAQEQGYHCASGKMFSEALRLRGLKPTKICHQRGWRGIRLVGEGTDGTDGRVF